MFLDEAFESGQRIAAVVVGAVGDDQQHLAIIASAINRFEAKIDGVIERRISFCPRARNTLLQFADVRCEALNKFGGVAELNEEVFILALAQIQERVRGGAREWKVEF